MATLSENFEHVTSENLEFENRQKEKIIWSFSHSRPIKNPVQETKTEIIRCKGYLTGRF